MKGKRRHSSHNGNLDSFFIWCSHSAIGICIVGWNVCIRFVSKRSEFFSADDVWFCNLLNYVMISGNTVCMWNSLVSTWMFYIYESCLSKHVQIGGMILLRTRVFEMITSISNFSSWLLHNEVGTIHIPNCPFYFLCLSSNWQVSLVLKLNSSHEAHGPSYLYLWQMGIDLVYIFLATQPNSLSQKKREFQERPNKNHKRKGKKMVFLVPFIKYLYL